MATVLDIIDDRLAAFLHAQPVFFVGTAPLSADGHVNLSPKGLAGSFRVLGPLAVAYRDLTGSGAESLAHIRENGRVVLMFCAFEGAPRIVRLHGRARVVTPEHEEWAAQVAPFDDHPGTRAVVHVEVTRVSTSCGFGVPLLELRSDRDLLTEWAERRTSAQLDEYHRTRNAESIDGLPALATEGD